MLELSARDHPQLKAKRLFYEAPRSCPGEGKGQGFVQGQRRGHQRRLPPKCGLLQCMMPSGDQRPSF